GQVSRIDQTTDVFALGAILYELLVLRPPYQGEGGTQIIERAAEGEITPPSARAARDPELRALLARLPGGRVPPELEAVAMHALAYLQSRRYPPCARSRKTWKITWPGGRFRCGAIRQRCAPPSGCAATRR
ncbi:MAG: hypothetical protein KJ044_05415, partial [Planctomycetes bacterium]|nr:hypothetical protein [Planctomycetota bacterium]